MTSIIEIPTEDLYPYETGRIEMTSSAGVRMRFSRTESHPFHLGVSVYQEKAPKGTAVSAYYIPLDMLRDLGVHLTSVAVQMTAEWHAMTPEQQADYNSKPVPMPNPGLVLVNRDDLKFMLDELQEARDAQIEMLNDPYARRSMEMMGHTEADALFDIDRMQDILAAYE